MPLIPGTSDIHRGLPACARARHCLSLGTLFVTNVAEIETRTAAAVPGLEAIGIIAGNRTLPLIFARQARQQGAKRLVAVAFEGDRPSSGRVGGRYCVAESRAAFEDDSRFHGPGCEALHHGWSDCAEEPV